MTGNLALAASLAQSALLVGQRRSRRSLGGLVAQCVLEENHVDEMEATNHPVEQGASITDHAFKLPSRLTLHYTWSASPSPQPGLSGLVPTLLPQSAQDIRDVYNKLLTMQQNRTLCDVYTGKRSYKNMLITSIEHDENINTANALPLTIQLQELILVNTTTATTGGVSSGTTTAPLGPVQRGGTFQLLPAPSYNPTRTYPSPNDGALQ